MSVWLERVEERLRKLRPRPDLTEATASLASTLLRGYKIPSTRREHAHLRLHAGLERLYTRWRSEED